MSEPPKEPVKYVEANVYLPYHYVAGDYRARYLRGAEGQADPRLEVLEDRQGLRAAAGQLAGELRAVRRVRRGRRTAASSPPSASSTSRSSAATCELPYVAASVALDGADISIFALIQECKPEDVRMGMRVEAVWKPDGERQGDHEDILYFRPTGEPDAPHETSLHQPPVRLCA